MYILKHDLNSSVCKGYSNKNYNRGKDVHGFNILLSNCKIVTY